MKTYKIIPALAVLLLAFVLVTTASAQEKTGAKDGKSTMTQQKTQNNGPRFVDEDGDGVCDNQKDGTARRQQHGRKGNGDKQRARLRDGSCGDTPGTGSGIRGRGQKNK